MLYTEIGPERLRSLVSTFYNEVFSNDILKPLFANSDRGEVEIKQFQFLTQFLGGPALYTEQHGQPKMRMRHFPHAITQTAKNEWLKCMHKAVYSLDLEKDLQNKLFSVFPKLAEHMVNS